MKLYHGSNVMIEKVDFAKCHPFKDFGCGFYLTDNIAHARNMAFRRCLRTGGDECVTEYEFDFEGALQNLKMKIFEKPSDEWAEFVMMNRNENITHPAHDYDIVIGPIADDAVVVCFKMASYQFLNWLNVLNIKSSALSISFTIPTPLVI